MTIVLKELLLAVGITALEKLSEAGEDLDREIDLAELETKIQQNRASRQSQLDQM